MIHHAVDNFTVSRLNELHTIRKCGGCGRFGYSCRKPQAEHIACEEYRGR